MLGEDIELFWGPYFAFGRRKMSIEHLYYRLYFVVIWHVFATIWAICVLYKYVEIRNKLISVLYIEVIIDVEVFELILIDCVVK